MIDANSNGQAPSTAKLGTSEIVLDVGILVSILVVALVLVQSPIFKAAWLSLIATAIEKLAIWVYASVSSI